MDGKRAPLAGMRVLEMGSRVAVPYLSRMLADAGADVCKVESPVGDPFRRGSSAGATIDGDGDSAWFRYLNGGKRSVVLDLDSEPGRARLLDLLADVDLVLDDHQPAVAARLGISAGDLRAANPAAVVATVTAFGTTGPWADRPADDLILQALVGATEVRGFPGVEPVSVGGELGGFVTAAFAAGPVLAATLAARSGGGGVHLDFSHFEAMMHAFQTYRPMYEAFAPEARFPRMVMIPSIEPASDGMVGFCCVTGQQWHDFCAMVGAPEMAEDEGLENFFGRMHRRQEVWEKIHAFTTLHTVDELVELANAFRIPAGPVATGDVLPTLDHFVERSMFVEHPQGFIAPRPPFRFSDSVLEPRRPAPALGDEGSVPEPTAGPVLGTDPAQPLAGLRVLDLSTFWAGPIAANLLRVLGADLVKVESHVRLDGMRWASGLQKDLLWEWSPCYHGANVGKTLVTLDLSDPRGIEVLERMVAGADVILESFSPRVTEEWGVTWEWIQGINPRAVFLRAPAYGLDGPWRDRGGFAMTMEQVGGLANRTGHVDGPLLVPMGPVDTLAGMHSAFAVIAALADRERTGLGQLVEVPLVEVALQASAEQVVEPSAGGPLLGPTGNRAPGCSPSGLYPTLEEDRWLAVSVSDDSQWEALVGVVADLVGVDRADVGAVDLALTAWTTQRAGRESAEELWRAGVPAAWCEHPNDTGASPQHDARGFLHWKEHPVVGSTPYFAFPFQVDGMHLALGGPAPVLDEHTDVVLGSLGYDEAAIAGLREAGVTGDWPVGIPRG